MTKTTSPVEFVRPATDFEVMQQEHIERLKAELAEARAEIERKDKLIEQMREALALFAEGVAHDFHYACQHRDNCLCLACQKARVKAALWRQKGASEYEL